ncbi:MAG: hypothetical protein K9M08_13555 [Pirellula sp.]|nr:hypothetical protein [Pirellula sp.]
MITERLWREVNWTQAIPQQGWVIDKKAECQRNLFLLLSPDVQYSGLN